MLEASAPGHESATDIINSISLVPASIEVQGSGLWKGKDTSKIEDFKNLEKTFDWSFSTPYKGCVHSLSLVRKSINEKEVQLDGVIPEFQSIADSSRYRFRLDHTSTEEIPIEMLGPENPIIHYGEVTLYEDELADKGYTKVNVRFRVMADCWFVLLRSYTRVDHVLVRIMDTRLFCRLPQTSGKLEIIRDFQHRESSYTSLKHKGFKFGSEWGLSTSQSDEVYPHLDLRLKVNDKLLAEELEE